MSQIILDYRNPVIDNIRVYDIYESIQASKFPYATSVSKADSSITKTVEKLAMSPAGKGEDTFLCGILCSFNLTFSSKAWTEFQRYHYAEIVSSQSTMHSITKFDLDSRCNEYVDPRMLAILGEKIAAYKANKSEENFLHLIYNIPSGFRLTARVTTNYRQLKTMYAQRRNHRLTPDWGYFCDAIEALPFSRFITGKEQINEG